MPTTRKRIERTQRVRVTPEAVAAYRNGDYLVLHRLLGLKPWEQSPLDVDPDDDPPEVRFDNAWEASWQKAVDLRAELES